MVFGVCRRVLRNPHDAEDAFQATFLVLARKVSSIRSNEMLASWLYGVAYRTALKAQAMNAKRRMKEKQASERPHAESSADEELLARLDHELNRLPDKYRVPVVLCELEGRTRKDVARILGVPEGTLSWRLAHAKKLLGRRLSRYGTVAVSALLAESAASACLSPLLRGATAKAALTAGAVPAKVLALTEGVMKAMLLSKLKITVCSGALMLLAGMGASGLTYRAAAQQPREGVALASQFQADELEALRLEIEALRKSLHATRERVTILEGEMRTIKRAERNPLPPTQGAREKRTPMPRNPYRPEKRVVPPKPETAPATPVPPDGKGGPPGVIRPSSGLPATTPPAGPSSDQPAGIQSVPFIGRLYTKPQEPANESLEHAEKALKQLRENLNDKEMIKVLERTLKELKEHEKQQELEKARQQRTLKQKQLKEREKRKKDLEKTKEPDAEGGASKPQ
jgi:RNA polymerase sigma factor (sigma-70 family)